MSESAIFGVGNGPDVLAYDASLGQLYVAAESGPLVVFQVDDGGVRELARDTVGPNAHSVAVDPATHHIFLPLTNVGGRPCCVSWCWRACRCAERLSGVQWMPNKAAGTRFSMSQLQGRSGDLTGCLSPA